jgi:uncharacterized protein (PEP-CTERM system associated)
MANSDVCRSSPLPARPASRLLTNSRVQHRAGRLTAAAALALCCGAAAALDWDIEPRITASETWSDNIDHDPDGEEESDLVTELEPGVRLSRQSQRLRVFVDYALQGLFYLDDSNRNDLNHRLFANANAELLEDFFYFDARSSYFQQVIDPRTDILSDNLTGNEDDRTDVATLTLSPYIRRDLSGYANLLARYTRDEVLISEGASDASTDTFDVNLGSGRKFTRFTWGASYFNSDQQREEADDFKRESSNVTARWALSRSFSLIGQAGYEDNEFTSNSEVPQNGSYWAAGAAWNPSRYLGLEGMKGNNLTSASVSSSLTRRTLLNVSWRDRAVGLNPGEVWSGTLTHFTRKSNWQASYLEDTQTSQLLDSIANPTGIILYAPDGSQFIVTSDGTLQQVLFDPGTGETFTLTDEVFTRKRGQLSVNYRLPKSNLGLRVFQEEREYLESLTNEQSVGANANWRWNVASRTTSTLTAGWQQSEYSDIQREDDYYYLQETVSRRISQRLTGEVLYRFTTRQSDDQAAEYDENRITARLTAHF